MMKLKLKLMCVSVMACLLLGAEANAQSTIGKPKINKCKDKDGVWHYGSSSLSQCADSSKITTINERGVRLKQVNEVMTPEQIAAEKKKQAQEKQSMEKIKFEQMEKKRILTVYQSEDDVERARIEKMISYDRKIEQHQNYIAALDNQKTSLKNKRADTTNNVLKRKYAKEAKTLVPKAETSKQRITELQKEKTQASEKFDQDLVIFRKYNN